MSTMKACVDLAKMPTQVSSMKLSLRERYVLAQALVLGIETLAKVEPASSREYSNMHDMGKLLRGNMLAPFTFAVLASLKAIGKEAETAQRLTGFVDVLNGETNDLPL